MSQAFDAAEQQSRLEERASRALALAAELGADACEVGASVDQGIGVGVRLGETESVELSRDQGIAVTVYVGQRKGNASSSDASDASLRAVVEKAIAIARHTGEDPAAGLAEAALMATELPDLDLHHPWALDTDAAIELALRCEQAGRERAGITNSEGASLSSTEAVTVYANSHGFLGSRRGTRHSLSCLLIAGSGERMQRDHDFTTARRASDLASPEQVGISAAERTLRRLDARRPRTGRFPVLFAPEMARGLVGNLLNSIAGGRSTASPRSSAISSGRRCFPSGSPLASIRASAAAWRVLPSMGTAWPPATTSSSIRAAWPATCCRLTALAASALIPPAMPAARATCASRRRPPNWRR